MTKPWNAIAWWEIRRIPFNVIVLVCGLISLAVYFEIGSRYVRPGEDVIEPPFLLVVIVLYALAANAAYTLGWITELLWSGGDTSRTEERRSKVFMLGMVASGAVTLLPAIFFPAAWAVMGFK